MADMITFPTKYIIQGENFGNMYLVCKPFEKRMFMLLIVLIVVITFSNFQEGFS